MSGTEIYLVTKAGDVQWYDDVRNAFRGAMLVWRNLAEKRLGWFEGMPPRMGDTAFQPVWDLAERQDVPTHERIVLAMTFDRVLVRREEIGRLVEAIREYCQHYDGGTLPQQADILERLAAEEDCQAVAWNQTSVNFGYWKMPHDTNEDESRPYNINRDTGHWYLFDKVPLGEPERVGGEQHES